MTEICVLYGIFSAGGEKAQDEKLRGRKDVGGLGQLWKEGGEYKS